MGFAAVMGAALPSVAMLFVVAALARVQTTFRKLRGARPRVVMGPTALVSIKYWSEALRMRGYTARTRVPLVASVNNSDDYDIVRDTLWGSKRLFLLFGHFLSMAWALWRAEVLVCFMDGSFLRWTRFWRLEGPLFRLAGKKLVITPYGSDVAVPGTMKVLEEVMLEDYPIFLEIGDEIRRRVDYYCEWADLVVSNYHQLGYQPRSDVLWPTILAIDTERWPEAPPGDGDGRNGPVTVVHAPNHRTIKGTQVLVDAIEELRAEGLDVELDMLEGRQNEEVRLAILAADVAVDQLVAGYAMFAIEGMSAGKPTVSAMGWLSPEYMATETMRALPLVDGDRETIKEVLSRLVENPEERKRIGAASRRFALEHHSYESVGRGWEAILDHLWSGAELPTELPPPAEPELKRG